MEYRGKKSTSPNEKADAWWLQHVRRKKNSVENHDMCMISRVNVRHFAVEIVDFFFQGFWFLTLTFQHRIHRILVLERPGFLPYSFWHPHRFEVQVCIRRPHLCHGVVWHRRYHGRAWSQQRWGSRGSEGLKIGTNYHCCRHFVFIQCILCVLCFCFVFLFLVSTLFGCPHCIFSSGVAASGNSVSKVGFCKGPHRTALP